MFNVPKHRSNTIYIVASALFAFFLWGIWAAYVNKDSTLNQRLLSGILQGSLSLVLTVVMVGIVNFFYQQFENSKMKLILPSVLTISCTGTLLSIAHFLANTPNIIRTILPPLCVGLAFCFLTTIKINKIQKDEKNESKGR